ncbi:MAG: glycosyltransferase family 1 protein [Bacteroidetes bacterium]|nr:MAG: glycosyltransferase family 1 protein [Bacteroidota bacterium]
MAPQAPIVCVGLPPWEGGDYLKSTVQLMQCLARTQRVLYVDYPYTYLDLWRARRSTKPDVPVAALADAGQRLQQLQRTQSGALYLLRLPPFVPANFLSASWAYDSVLAFNARRARLAIRQALTTLGWETPIVINAFNPALGNALAGKLGEQQLVYYCYDEISAAPWISRHGSRHERAFLAQVDLTIVSSTGLAQTKAPLTKRCAVVKNGVDLSLFRAGAARPADLPEGPLIGYLGSVDDRLDYELLERIARSFPQAKLVILGRLVQRQKAMLLDQHANVYVLGSRPPEQLGAYVAHFDLGLIPFVKNELTAGIYPLKINEYLALGKPVVSTDFADLSDFTDYCYIATDHEAFLEQVAATLAGTSPGCPATCRAFAQRNSWESRAVDFARLLGLEVPLYSSQTSVV